MSKDKHSVNSPKGRLVEIDGVSFQVINGKLHRYADLTLDKGFKIVLGRIGSEEVLKNLLNRILGTCIKKLEYRNTEHPGMTEEERSSRFDVYCEEENGICFQVEMQNWSQKFFHKRAVYYSSLALHDQTTKAQRKVYKARGKWDYDYQPLYVVSFLNFRNWTYENTGEKRNEFISLYRYKDIETGNELGDGTNLVFVDLHRFTKSIEDCSSLEDIWMYSIKNMTMLDSCPDKIKGTEIEELFFQSELAKMTPEQRIKFEEEFMTQNDILNSIEEQLEDARKEAIAVGLAEGREEGRIEGRAEGREEGRAEGRAEGRVLGREEANADVARKLMDMQMDIESIAAITGMSMEKIRTL